MLHKAQILFFAFSAWSPISNASFLVFCPQKGTKNETCLDPTWISFFNTQSWLIIWSSLSFVATVYLLPHILYIDRNLNIIQAVQHLIVTDWFSLPESSTSKQTQINNTFPFLSVDSVAGFCSTAMRKCLQKSSWWSLSSKYKIKQLAQYLAHEVSLEVQVVGS